MLITQAIITGIITSILCTIAILASLAHNSRIWVGDMPKAMQAAMTPLSDAEKRLKLFWSIPIMLVMFGYPIYAGLQFEANNGGFNFAQAYLFFAIVWITWNLWDLLIVDWFIIVWWKPSIFDIPDEVAHLWHLNSYRFHLIQSLKGCVLVAVLSAIVALIFALL